MGRRNGELEMPEQEGGKNGWPKEEVRKGVTSWQGKMMADSMRRQYVTYWHAGRSHMS